jgi:hypothetical protein
VVEYRAVSKPKTKQKESKAVERVSQTSSSDVPSIAAQILKSAALGEKDLESELESILVKFHPVNREESTDSS